MQFTLTIIANTNLISVITEEISSIIWIYMLILQKYKYIIFVHFVIVNRKINLQKLLANNIQFTIPYRKANI